MVTWRKSFDLASPSLDSVVCIHTMPVQINKHVGIFSVIVAIAICLFLVQPCESSQVEERHLTLESSFPQSIQSLREDISNPVPYVFFVSND